MAKVKLFDLLFRFKETDYEKIVFNHPYKELKSLYDIGIIFGGISMIPYRVEEGIRLYKQQQIKKILVSGKNPLFCFKKNSEAEKMYKYLINHGVLKEDIIIENKARNTLENIKYSLNLLKKDYDIKSLSFVLITSDFHVKRCMGMLNHILGTKENIYGVGVKDSLTDRKHWKRTKYGKKIVQREAFLLWYYAKKGFYFE